MLVTSFFTNQKDYGSHNSHKQTTNHPLPGHVEKVIQGRTRKVFSGAVEISGMMVMKMTTMLPESNLSLG